MIDDIDNVDEVKDTDYIFTCSSLVINYISTNYCQDIDYTFSSLSLDIDYIFTYSGLDIDYDTICVRLYLGNYSCMSIAYHHYVPICIILIGFYRYG